MNLISPGSDRHWDGSGILHIMRMLPPPPPTPAHPRALVPTSAMVWPTPLREIPEDLLASHSQTRPQVSSCAFPPPPPCCGLKVCVPPNPYVET